LEGAVEEEMGCRRDLVTDGGRSDPGLGSILPAATEERELELLEVSIKYNIKRKDAASGEYGTEIFI
jgi:hypothetical protein